MVKECYRCHSAQAEKLKGGLRLDSREAMLRGGDTGPAVVPGKSSESLLVHALRHEDGLEMPPKGPGLDGDVIARFVKWIDAGANPRPRLDNGGRRASSWRHWQALGFPAGRAGMSHRR